MLYCMHDNLIGEFKVCLTAKGMLDKLKIRFGHTSSTRLRILHLKWVQHKMDSTHTIVELLRSMSVMVRDLKVARRGASPDCDLEAPKLA